MTRITATAAAILVAVLAFVPSVTAQDLNPLEKTYLTFSAPVELPGMQLPAGTYTFKLADTPSRNVVQVLSRDEKTVHGQFLFVQSKRTEATGEPVVMFRETAEGITPAVQYWYYPGETIGKEFVYPKDQATKIAARTHTRVLSTDGDITRDSQVSAIDDSGKLTPIESESAAPPAPAPQARADVAPPQPAPVTPPSTPALQQAPQPAPAAPPAPANDTAVSPRSELPQTASPVPLVALLGMLSVVAGLGVRAFRS